MKRPRAGAPDLEDLALIDPEAAVRWRLILGPQGESEDGAFDLRADGAGGQTLSEREALDRAMGFVYIPTPTSGRADLSRAAAYIPEWLDLIRSNFSTDTVSLLIRDALDRRGLSQLLLEPETLADLEPDPALVAVLLALKDAVPERARAAIRELVQKLVAKLERKIRQRLTTSARRSALKRRASRGSYRTLDWSRTLHGNLKHYNLETQRLVPERFYFRSGEQSTGSWRVVLLVDQSGSMAETVVHAAVAASVLASVRSLETRLVLFGPEVADMSDRVSDPTAVLLGAQVGGGTDIAAAVSYASQLVSNPGRTLFILITDLYEGGDEEALARSLAALNESGCRTACVLALSSDGRADYNDSLAHRLSALGTPSFTAPADDLVDLLSLLWGEGWPPAESRYGA